MAKLKITKKDTINVKILEQGYIKENPTSIFEDFIYKFEKFPGGEILITSVSSVLNWAKAKSPWALTFGLACCAIELMATYGPEFDAERIGSILRATPRQADLMIVAGTVTIKMAPRIKRLYDQMPYPKWVIAMGSCAISGDHYRNVYSVVPGVDQVVPVDIYVPGCPPTPDALINGIIKLSEKVEMEYKQRRNKA
ncbi:MAG: NADH-quinone oxidoreductase subunit B [candidate division WOR-3 bacterium]|nr:NADH-quinone oxidoreductase subunit B [candidate division WOR-3 bacterium]MCX7947588.1 NADH-quinone oxidoreductase subunit B [candidate division WOR-3 bacterium]MDW8150473.1 NADH-quinone oxidoreductase subunit B family protein [candidate division WOR-3 bacterium]